MDEERIIRYKLSQDKSNIEFEIPFFETYRFDQITRLKGEEPAFQKYQVDYNHYRIPFNMVRVASILLKTLGLSIDSSEIQEVYGGPQFSDIGQSFLRDEQYEYMKKVFHYFSGLLTLPTGFGKNTMMVYMVQASLEYQKNILIMAPTYSIIDEIITRFAQYNTPISKDYDVSQRVWAINPVALMSSKRLENAEIVQWLQDCTMLIMDECQEINNSQEELLTSHLPNCLYRFGLSASSDKFYGSNLTHFHSLSHLNPETFRILEYFGPAIVYKPPQRKIRIVDTMIPFGDYRNYWSYDKCINHLCHHKLMPQYIAQCLDDNNKDGHSTVLFPFTNRAHVSHFLTDPTLSRFHIIIWTASGIQHNNNIPEERGAGLDRVKELVNEGVDLVFCTSVGYKGIDLSGFRSVIFMTSSSYGMITQILGRAFRYKGPGLVNVYIARCMGDNPLYNASYWKRRKMLMENNEYEVETKHCPPLPFKSGG